MATPLMAILLPILPLLLGAIVLVLLLYHQRSSKAKQSTLPPGSVGLIPVLGETLQLIAAYKTEDPEPFIDRRVLRHGSRLFTTHVFGERTVFSADPDFNRAVLAGEGRAFEVSYPSSITSLLGRHSLLLMRGRLHKRMHSLTLTRFASQPVLRCSLLPDIDRLVRRTLGSWEDGMTVRLLDQAKKISFELTVKQLMGFDPGEWTEALRREYLLVIDGFFSIPFPSFLYFTTYAKALKARTKVAEALRGVVRERREEKMKEESMAAAAAEEEFARKKKKDMLEELMEAEEGGFSEEELVDFMLALLVAGYETTSTIMTLAVKFLTEAPPALSLLKKEHEEIRSRKKDEGEPLEWSDYKSMPFTQCVINETLRVANIISGVFRRATIDVHFKGYTIPKGCKVFASFRAVHLDLHNYKEARTFNPWRWQSNDTTGSGTGTGIFTPFGGGSRLCPGYELARLEISVFLHHLVTRFSWDVVEEDKLVFFPTTRTLKGYPVTVKHLKAF